MKHICVFCGSSNGDDPRFRLAARQLGALIADRGLGLVYGGATVGLMGAVADAVLERGGHVTGVIPSSLVERELAHNGLPDLRVVASMHERKALMADLSDAFVALPGGIGTLEETFEVLTWAQLGLHHKPVGILDAGGYYASLLAFLGHAVASRFVRQEFLSTLSVDEDPGRLLDRLAARAPVGVEKGIDPATI